MDIFSKMDTNSLSDKEGYDEIRSSKTVDCG